MPTQLITALDVLYGHYKATFERWRDAGIRVPPCFIVVCNNTSTSKLIYDYIAGFERKDAHGNVTPVPGRFELFRNSDAVTGNPLARPNTLLIDSQQLESGEAMEDNFRQSAADEIERFRRAEVALGQRQADEAMSDQELLREVMNSVGKPGRLGEGVQTTRSSTATGRASPVESSSSTRLRSYVKNQGLGFEVPYQHGAISRMYRPDFIVRVDDGRGADDLLNLVIEIKGYRGEEAKDKKAAMETSWVPGVNRLGTYGRWAFAEIGQLYRIDADFKAKVQSEADAMIQAVLEPRGEP